MSTFPSLGHHRFRRACFGFGFGFLAVAVACNLMPTASAQDGQRERAAWRFGAVAHNLHIGGYGDMQSHEGGANLEGELIGRQIDWLNAVWSPRPYVMVSGNLGGDTSFVATGLYWGLPDVWGWQPELGFGLALHDGELHNPYPLSDPRAADYQREHQLLGTRTLFRDTIAFDHSIGRGRSVGIVFEHLSNAGNLFGHRDNESLNELGLRFTVQIR
ncbi:MAG TPA: acyloxyacyl hydrolase [Hyphomonadaceae bacterium]|nr:acyloxyacyl hydrolase [Hyphomonadaceae bacterium]